MTFSSVRLAADLPGVKQVNKFKSSHSGLICYHIDVPAPLVNGYFVLATESFTDKGLPHTLEHLVFMGSREFPYKGVLDSLANRSLAQGTNAWTDVDHTCYTLTTAGYDGFLRMLPIYLDHILNPLLKNEAFLTEIVHTNGKGQTMGVVVCEMQGRQNSPHDLLHLNLQRLLYPESGYAYETGGLVDSLRQLTADEVRNYHRDYYRSDNLCLVLVGSIPQDKLMASLNEIDATLLKDVKRNLSRPWVDSKPAKSFTASVHKDIQFPDEEESSDGSDPAPQVGMVMVGWRGPKSSDAAQKLEFMVAMECLLDYLTDSPVSLLQKTFVEVEEDASAASIEFSFLHFAEPAYFLLFEGVPVGKTKQLYDELVRTLSKHTTFDLDRMKTLIKRKKLRAVDSLESRPADYVIHPIIADFLYGARDASSGASDKVPEDLQEIHYLDLVLGYDAQKWIQFTRQHLIDRPCANLAALPSQEFARKLQQDESSYVEATCKRLGEEGLKKCERALELAKEENEKPIPSEMLTSFKVPDVALVPQIPVIVARYENGKVTAASVVKNSVEQKVDGDLSKLKQLPAFPIFFSHIESTFVEFNIFLDTQNLDAKLRPYLGLYLDLMFSLPIEHGDVTFNHEQVVKGLNEDTVSYWNEIGLNSRGNFAVGQFGQYVIAHIKVERAKYARGIWWISQVLLHGKFTSDRVNISVNKLLNDLPNHKREGMKMCRDVLSSNMYDSNKSNHATCSVSKQQKFLASLASADAKNMDDVLKDLDALRKTLISPSNVRVNAVGDVLAIPNSLEEWTRFWPSVGASAAASIKIPYSKQVSVPFDSIAGKVFLLPMPAIESSFGLFATCGPDTFDHPDLPILMVLDEYLTTMEGLFWKQVRGNGLAYSVSLNINVEAGTITFMIYRSQNGHKAYMAVHGILNDLQKGKLHFEQAFLDAAKSSVIYGLVARGKTMADAGKEAFMNMVLRGVGQDANRELMRKVQQVEIADLKRVLEKYLEDLTQTNKSVGFVTCSPTLSEPLSKGWSDQGFNIVQLSQ